MDFERVLKTVVEEFDQQHIRYAAVGGFAVGALGAFRATRDVDFLVHRDDLSSLDRVLTARGYQRIAQTENVSHYTHPDASWGSLDFLHAFREISRHMLARATRMPIFEGRLTIPVAKPEDVIGLKIQAIANNPRRRAREQYDIEQLAEIHGHRLDWECIQSYFDLFEMGQEGKELRAKYERPQ